VNLKIQNRQNTLVIVRNVKRNYRNEGEVNHYCPNFYGCPPQIIGRIQHYISRKAMDIEGLGGETVAYCSIMI
jgi:NAD-dependent DNA ligase